MFAASNYRPKLSLLVAIILSLVVGVIAPASSQANKTETIKPVKVKRNAVVFNVKGFDPREIRRAKLRVRKVKRAGKTNKTRKVTRKVRLAAVDNSRLQIKERRVREGKLTVVSTETSGSNTSETSETSASTGGSNEGVSDAGSSDSTTNEGPVVTTKLSPTSKMGPVPSNAFYIAPNGSDAADGSKGQPWKTIDHAVDSVQAGDTVVILPGTYGDLGVTHDMNSEGTATAPITFRGEPGGEMPRILGHFKIRGSYQQFNYLLFDGPTGQIKTPTADNPNGEQVQVSILGDNVDGIEISDSEIRDSLWHAGIYASKANDVRFTGNYIHNNGDRNDPGQANQSHGIYFAKGSGLIVNNVISANVARGIQMYDGPDGLTVANNTVVGNGKTGIQFGNETSNSIAVNNLVAYNGEYGIRSAYLTGTGNVVTNNLVWENGTKSPTAIIDGLVWENDNIEANPGFDKAADLTITTGGAATDAADANYAPAIDFTGKSRSTADIGAYEIG